MLVYLPMNSRYQLWSCPLLWQVNAWCPPPVRVPPPLCLPSRMAGNRWKLRKCHQKAPRWKGWRCPQTKAINASFPERSTRLELGLEVTGHVLTDGRRHVLMRMHLVCVEGALPAAFVSREWKLEKGQKTIDTIENNWRSLKTIEDDLIIEDN